MMSRTGNTLDNMRQHRTIRATAPGTLLSRLCMLTMVLLYTAAIICGTADAATITVRSSGCDYTTIQAAVNAASAGDVIIVGGEATLTTITADSGDHVVEAAADCPVVLDPKIPVVSTCNDSSLTSAIDDALENDKTVFLLFYTDWCHFCQQQKPVIDELEQEYSDEITFIRVNIEDNPSTRDEFNVNGFPTMFLIFNKSTEGYEYQTRKGFTEKLLKIGGRL